MVRLKAAVALEGLGNDSLNEEMIANGSEM